MRMTSGRPLCVGEDVAAARHARGNALDVAQDGQALAREDDSGGRAAFDDQRQQCAVSLASAGRKTLRTGIARNAARCSIG